jgi:hypothetical protein
MFVTFIFVKIVYQICQVWVQPFLKFDSKINNYFTTETESTHPINPQTVQTETDKTEPIVGRNWV